MKRGEITMAGHRHEERRTHHDTREQPPEQSSSRSQMPGARLGKLFDAAAQYNAEQAKVNRVLSNQQSIERIQRWLNQQSNSDFVSNELVKAKQGITNPHLDGLLRFQEGISTNNPPILKEPTEEERAQYIQEQLRLQEQAISHLQPYDAPGTPYTVFKEKLEQLQREIPQASGSQDRLPVASSSQQRDTHSDPPPEVTSIRDSGEATEQNIDNIMRGLDYDKLCKFMGMFANKRNSIETKKSIMIIKSDFINFELILRSFRRTNEIYDKKFAAYCYNSIKTHYYSNKLNYIVEEWYTQIGFDYAQDTQQS